MRFIKIAGAFACFITILIIALAFTGKNLETEMYEETVDMLMKQEGMTSDLACEERYPILVDVKTNLNLIASLNQIVLNKSRNPAPMVTEDEASQMEYYQQQIQQLKKVVRKELTQLIAEYTKKTTDI